jgi:tRNA(Ile2) C34 agmatinyltransferase TiaS
VEDTARTHALGYYAGVALSVHAAVDRTDVDLGDGGLTTWTAQLLADDKERCLVSCVATERLAQVAASSG